MIPLYTEEKLNAVYESWDRDGYVVVNDCFSQADLNDIEQYFEDFKNKDHKIYKDGKTHKEIDPTKEILRAMQPHRVSEEAKVWVTNPRVAQVLDKLLGKPALVAQTMYYYKPPGSVGQSLHQDNFYLLSQPATCMAAWTPIDDCDEENGCLRVIPGSHRGEIVCPSGKNLSEADKDLLRRGKLDGTHLGGLEPVEVPLTRGQTMFFNGQLIHGSNPNVSKTRSRRTFIGHYVDRATTSMSHAYFPLLTMDRERVDYVEEHKGGGPCADLPEWAGAVH